MSMILYFECCSGISGDMAVAAMLDVGADREALDRALSSLDIGGFEVSISRKQKSGLDVCDFDVVLEHDNHDHDMQYLYGEGHHVHEHHHGRGPAEIREIISKADMSERARAVSYNILDILAEAEASAHGIPVDKVHFHEVGAVDSIVDIISLGVCLDSLDVDGVCFSELYEGTGTVRCQHGVIPVPVPAVVNILASHRELSLRMTQSQGEFVTPTGAAFAAAARTCDVPGSFRIERVGMGGGKRDTDRSGILRAMIITPTENHDIAVKLECNIDDCTGEALGYTAERLMAEGAKDAHYTPVFMKKGRPAWLLTVICSEFDRHRLESVIFSETSTAGIRRCTMDRTVMSRRSEDVETSIGKVRVKVLSMDGIEKVHPEYECLAAICREKGIPFREAYETVMKEIGRRI